MIKENNAALLAIIQNQAEQVAAESPLRKFFTAIASLLVEQESLSCAAYARG
ncbi:MAG: hypothetical protein IPO36_23530 [Anaerolineales bacterium]|nr:hypothetical protein [Anaerolineales bacterium]